MDQWDTRDILRQDSSAVQLLLLHVFRWLLWFGCNNCAITRPRESAVQTLHTPYSLHSGAGLGQLWAPLACVYICIRLRGPFESHQWQSETEGGRGRQGERYHIDTSFALAAFNGSRSSPNASALMRILRLTSLSRLPYLRLTGREREREGGKYGGVELQLGRVTGPFV